MQPIIMQDWITIRGTASDKIFQSQSGWIDTGPFQDMTFFVDVREFTGTTPTLAFETAPGRDDMLFQECVAAFNVSTGATVVKNCFLVNASVPVSQWTRWKLTGPAAAWDVTFRVMAAGNSIC